MSVHAHLQALNEEHHKLDEAIKNAYIHHLPDLELQELKKEKLKLRDKIVHLRQREIQSNDN